MAMEQNAQNAMQQMFGAFSNGSEIAQRNARTFWENQSELLDKMQVFANGWFERRRAGTNAALEASERMCRASTSAECLGEYQKWIGGVSERLMADLQAFQSELRDVTQVLAPSVVPSTAQEHTRQEHTGVAKKEAARARA